VLFLYITGKFSDFIFPKHLGFLDLPIMRGSNFSPVKLAQNARNNIVFGTMSGERGDVDKNIVENWKEKLPKLCEGYEPKNIFNMDETEGPETLIFRPMQSLNHFRQRSFMSSFPVILL
jgi:hypothetical protein